MTDKEIKALERLTHKLSALRKTLRGDERKLLDQMVLSAQSEVTAHSADVQRPVSRPTERPVSRPQPRIDTASEVALHSAGVQRPVSRPTERPVSRPQARVALMKGMYQVIID